MSRNQKYMWCIPLVVSIAAVTGCSGGTPSDSDDADAKTAVQKSGNPKEQVTITVLTVKDRMPEADFKLLITDPVKKKYPNIDVVPLFGGTGKLDAILTGSDAPPDLVMFWNGEMQHYVDRNMILDMRGLIKETNFDLNRYQPNVIGGTQGPGGEIFGLPYHMNVNAMYYNKDLFDKFGLSYPKDGMFWEDVYDLSRALTRTVDGVQYLGYHFDNFYRVHAPLSLNQADDKLGKATVNNDQWKKPITVMKTLREISNYKLGNMRKQFMEDKTLAMGGSVVELLPLMEEPTKAGLNWEVAQYPSYKERPNTSGYMDLHAVGITTLTKNKDVAMTVIDTFLSDEVQLMNVRQKARVSPFKDKKFVEQYAKDAPAFMQGKNVQSIFKSNPAPVPAGGVSKYYTKVNPVFVKYVNEVADGKKDMNTALREAEDAMNQVIALENK
jgi:ABC-type glycerol-3-phosphate transport system substrate-binding protein